MMKLGLHLMKATLTGALGGLLFGFDTVVVSGVIDALVRLYGLSAQMKGWTMAIALIGTVVGALSAGVAGQKLGGRETLRITALLYVISAIGSGLAWNWPSLMVFRLVGGLGIGASSVMGPVYIAEIAPAKWRGRLVGLFQLNIVVGLLLAYASNYVIRLFSLGAAEWRWQLGVAAVPALILMVLLSDIPRSPRWLVSRNRIEEALVVLKQMGESDAMAELEDIRSALKEECASTDESVLRWKYRRPLFLAISIGAFNQLTGINAILYYLNNLFAAAGFSQISSDQQAIAIGFTCLVFTAFAMFLIDKLGRKTLLLIGAAGTGSCLAGIAWLFKTHSHPGALVWLLITFIAFFAFSQGAVVWVYIGEVFPNSVRSKGQGVGNASNWVVNTAITLEFPVVVQYLNTQTPFIFFSTMMVAQFFVVLLFYPETKGQTLEALQRKLIPEA